MDMEFYVSYKAQMDDDKMQLIYCTQNKWLERVKVISVGGECNINKRFNVPLPALCLKNGH